MEDLFRHRVLRLLLDEGKLRPERVKMLLGWRHSGFNLDASVRVGARDNRGRENISRYIIRAPFSVGKLRYLADRNTVIYKTKLVKGLNRNFGLYSSIDFLAAVTAHIPNEWEHLTRYYGYYSSVQRGKRIKAGLEERASDQVTIADDSPGASVAHRNWARFIKKIYEVDPLLCPVRGHHADNRLHRGRHGHPAHSPACGIMGRAQSAAAAYHAASYTDRHRVCPLLRVTHQAVSGKWCACFPGPWPVNSSGAFRDASEIDNHTQ